ncbi:unnamed protein product [Lepeophtheirus salmonis]|uniref:(salmon louse) hypothetical protein n=1 Tax=Lepeophtheirus salmonis TaxID=72036 RepID=A0A7R8CKI3_LEPSM|nr:unnamed protein product [Lepeophtheirus salmonis]CAF2816209.1 unnamed protein product [Lepeophtheirus salmonis]
MGEGHLAFAMKVRSKLDTLISNRKREDKQLHVIVSILKSKLEAKTILPPFRCKVKGPNRIQTAQDVLDFDIVILGGVSNKFKSRIFAVMFERMRGRFSNKFSFHNICGICSSLSTERDPRISFHLADILYEYPLQLDEVKLPIGQDYYWEIVQNKFICSNDGNLVALHTPFGYVLNIRLPVNSLTSTSCLLSILELGSSQGRHKIAVLEDVRKMLLQIVVDVHDRDAIRYLWRNLNINEPPQSIPKLMLRDLCTLNLEWNNELPADTLVRWMKCVTQVSRFSQLSFERSFNMDSRAKKGFQIHSFKDASKDCIVAAVYIWIKYDFGNSKRTLLITKSRLAPKKTHPSIARLELLAAILVARFVNNCKTKLDIGGKSCYYWTDSETAVREIHSLSDPIDWRHVPGSLKLPSRGLTLDKLVRNFGFWINGPEFIHQEKGNWPKRLVFCPRCFEWKWFTAKPQQQMMSVLPEERINPGMEPFSAIGLDCLGPVYIRYDSGKKEYFIKGSSS